MVEGIRGTAGSSVQTVVAGAASETAVVQGSESKRADRAEVSARDPRHTGSSEAGRGTIPDQGQSDGDLGDVESHFASEMEKIEDEIAKAGDDTGKLIKLQTRLQKYTRLYSIVSECRKAQHDMMMRCIGNLR